MPNISLARSASHFRNQESEDKNRETRTRAKIHANTSLFASFAFFAVEIGFHLIPDKPAESLGFASLTTNLYRHKGTARRAYQVSGIRSVTGGVATGKKQQNTDRFSSDP
ncbi:MAG: hypothetical protein LBM17_02735 [Candidatus Accumulibacter sp.]|jgi:hypothetical protein|nr:hypothetical protein [Accumulibacter sp.]